VGLAAAVDLAGTYALGAGSGAVNALLGGPPDQYPDRYEAASPLSLLPLGVKQLLIHGTADEALPIELTRGYVQAAKSSGDDVEYVELHGAGHMDYLDPKSNAHATLCRWLGSHR
jgi:dipeptidyl aminopeptidase/acylaminoacyl peptidase